MVEVAGIEPASVSTLLAGDYMLSLSLVQPHFVRTDKTERVGLVYRSSNSPTGLRDNPCKLV